MLVWLTRAILLPFKRRQSCVSCFNVGNASLPHVVNHMSLDLCLKMISINSKWFWLHPDERTICCVIRLCVCTEGSVALRWIQWTGFKDERSRLSSSPVSALAAVLEALGTQTHTAFSLHHWIVFYKLNVLCFYWSTTFFAIVNFSNFWNLWRERERESVCVCVCVCVCVYVCVCMCACV